MSTHYRLTAKAVLLINLCYIKQVSLGIGHLRFMYSSPRHAIICLLIQTPFYFNITKEPFVATAGYRTGTSAEIAGPGMDHFRWYKVMNNKINIKT